MIDLSKKERKILKFWQKEKIFAKSIKQRQGCPLFSFYDGPPFATGKPHYGHILATTIKDVVLRYWTMKGYQVPRRVGWDCHGLPVENLVEQKLNLSSKKEIEKDIKKFNQTCRSSVFDCVSDWEKTLARVGRWADYSNYYATLDNDYIESVWWVFKQLWDQGLVYQDYRVSPYCPRCGTPISNFEVNQGYKEVEDVSVFVKFKFENEDKYFLAWTTTPWTLPGNVALAVNPKEDYVEVKTGQDTLILANQRLGLLADDYKIIKQLKGKDLVGLKYEPLFNFTQKDKEAWRVVEADFVSMDDGTGIVHIAPYGEEDMVVINQNKLSVVLDVDLEGKFIPEVKPWAGLFVKEADPKIIENLHHRNLLFKTKKIKHSYPFCWRCDSPLLYYPLNSWYIAVTKLKSQLVENNQKIHWVPRHLKHGRFGKWLAGARDWSISRSRFWGAPIPIWQCDKCDKKEVIGDFSKIAELSGRANTLYLLRHAQSKHNLGHFADSKVNSKKSSLTAQGKKDVLNMAKQLKKEKLDFIIASPLLRTKQTAQIIAKELGLEIIFNNNLVEYKLGSFDGRPTQEFRDSYGKIESILNKNIGQAESLKQLWQRMKKFTAEVNLKYKGKKILVVSHGWPLWLLDGYLAGIDIKRAIHRLEPSLLSLKKRLSKVIDPHRPAIDEISFKCVCGGQMNRINDVFDCWFESGSMPYAQWHYPFENKKMVEATFPANFIAEGLDQTRGWFYTLHVLAAALSQKNIGLGKKQPAFKNVVVNGLVLAEDGKKLSKKLRNYVEPDQIFEKYGVDALRYFLLASTPIGEDYLFSDKKVEEVWRRVIMTLWNIYAFFDSYTDLNLKIDYFKKPQSKNILDKWILSKLAELNYEIVQYMNDYELTKACRLFDGFIDDLSNWYVRRSRRRFQKPETEKEKTEACQVLGYTLFSLINLIAPFAPFISEEIYQKLRKFNQEKKLPLSVHLTDYLKPNKAQINENLSRQMIEVRQMINLGLAARARAGIKVRQPLSKITFRAGIMAEGLLELIRDELNFKKVIINSKNKEEVEIDTQLTPELKEEGLIRDLIRQIQSMRKDGQLKPHHQIYLRYSGDQDLIQMIQKWQAYILQEVLAGKIENGQKRREVFLVEKEMNLEGKQLWLGLKKI